MDERLLAARHGVYRDREAERFGIGRLRNGSVKGYVIMRGVRCLLPPPWSVEARMTAAVLAGGEGALLTGDSWLQAFGHATPRPLAPVDVLIAEARRERRTPLGRYQRTRVLEAAPRRDRQRLTLPLAADVGVASARSVVTQLGASYEAAELRGVLASLIQQRIVTREDVTEWTALHPRLPGAKRAAGVAADLAGGADSEGEFSFLQLAKAVGLPPDYGHVNVYCKGVLISTTDAWWAAGVPGYFDGRLHHGWKKQQSDVRIRSQLANAGLRPFIVTAELRDDRRLFAATLRARLREAAEAIVKTWQLTAGGIELAA